jgi:pimeloyl-ACP methyl ester carboxylesterase
MTEASAIALLKKGLAWWAEIVSQLARRISMRASTIAVPVSSDAVSDLHALVIEPNSVRADSSILLFLHGKGEAGSSLGSLPLVCIHQTAPFQALLGHLPETLVVAPQAPPIPTIDDWNWREYVKPLAEFLTDRYAKKRVVATGFSRGGLGVLQLVSAYPDLVQAWAVVDPQPARDQAETNAILPRHSVTEQGWLRYGLFRDRDEVWKNFSSLLLDRLPNQNRDVAELQHTEMAVQAYGGSSLSAESSKKNLYEFLGLKYEPSRLA